MTKRVQLAVALVIAQLLTGCGGTSWQTPSAPSRVAPAPAASSTPVMTQTPAGFVPNITLSGTVYEIVQDARVPIEGADIYCEPCLELTHSWATTDRNGFYSFTGVWGTYFPISVGKKGYEDPPGTRSTSGFPGSGWRDVTINGDTRFDVQLVRK